MANGRSRELDPANLGIKELIGTPRDLQINIMPGQYTISSLKEALDPNYCPEGMPFGVYPLRDGRFYIVNGIEENDLRRSELIYGVFNAEGNVLPDPYSCVRVIGRYQRVRETIDKIAGLLR